jgi:hypothetical protein
LVWIDSIDKSIIKGQKNVSFSFGQLLLVGPHFFKPLLELCTVVAAEGDDPETVLYSRDIVLDSYEGIGEGLIHGIDNDPFEDI